MPTKLKAVHIVSNTSEGFEDLIARESEKFRRLSIGPTVLEGTKYCILNCNPDFNLFEACQTLKDKNVGELRIAGVVIRDLTSTEAITQKKSSTPRVVRKVRSADENVRISAERIISEYEDNTFRLNAGLLWNNSFPTGLPTTNVVVVCVCKIGKRASENTPPSYSPDHVAWLHRQVSANLTTPHRFVCLTDKPDECAGGVALWHDWPGWWAKMELFRPGLFVKGEIVLFLDLDTVLTKPFAIPPPPPLGDLAMVTFGINWWGKYGSGVMCWRAPFTSPYEWFVDKSDLAMDIIPGDQDVIAFSTLNGGGKVVRVGMSQVQEMNKPEAVPIVKPECPIWCAAGSGAKPWNTERDWIPRLHNSKGAEDVALIVGSFGKDAVRNKAAIFGAKELSRLNPAPGLALLVEANADGSTAFPDWFGETLKVPFSEKNLGLWHKENLWNIGAREAIARGYTKLIFDDIDVFPAEGEWDWCERVSNALDSCDVLSPWSEIKESDGEKGQWPSFSAQVAIGVGEIWCGQGFVIALTSDWWTKTGGFPENGIQGGGDSLTIEMWDASGSANPLHRLFPDLCDFFGQYDGPKTDYGFMEGKMIHKYHGSRFGKDDNRMYRTRYLVWEMAGGPDGVVKLDKTNNLWAWTDTPKGRAVKEVAVLRPREPQEVLELWKAACSKNGLEYDEKACREIAFRGIGETSCLKKKKKEIEMPIVHRTISGTKSCVNVVSHADWKNKAAASPFWEGRWEYLGIACGWLREIGIPDTGSILEVENRGFPLVPGSDRFDPEPAQVDGVWKDKNVCPWPVKERYSTIVALQVLEYLVDPASAIKEMTKRADWILISYSYLDSTTKMDMRTLQKWFGNRPITRWFIPEKRKMLLALIDNRSMWNQTQH